MRTETSKQQLQDAVSAWIIVHSRADDTVSFGPFSTIADAHEWLAGAGRERGVRGWIVPIVKPDADESSFWTGAGDLIMAHLTPSH